HAINLIARKMSEQTSRPLVVVGAHYDTVDGSRGADDNASAVAALLEFAHWIGPRLSDALPAGLQLAAYDLGEACFIGSSGHVQDLERAGRALRGMISLEMLGYTDQRPGSQRLPPHLTDLYPDVANFIGVCANEDSQELMEIVVQGLKSIVGLPVEFIVVPGRGETLPPVRLSDHSPFWDSGY